MSGKAQWFTPIAALKNKEDTWSKLENTGWKAAKLPQSPRLNYFNNPQISQETSTEYDLFFSYTKPFPLWDQRKLKDNRCYLPDVWENIHQQEKVKPVPALTSQNYGNPAYPLLDIPETEFRRTHAMADFNRRHGVMKVIEKKQQQ